MSWWLPRVRGRFVDSGGVPIHLTDEGSGEPVLLLHGFAVNSDLNWRLPGVVRALRRRFRVIAIDQRGHGLSGKPKGAAHYGAEMANDVPRVLDALGIERAHLVGYSLGGFVALRVAATRAERLHSVGVLGAGWERPDESAFVAALTRLAEQLEARGTIGPLSGQLGADRRRPSWRHEAWVRIATKLLNDPLALASVVRGTRELAVEEHELTGIELPVCSIVGERDPLLAGALLLEGRVRRLTRVVVPNADHVQAPMRRSFRDSLLRFLEGARD